jgi:RNA polymerase sigma-70 factor (ECF subfamily)
MTDPEIVHGLLSGQASAFQALYRALGASVHTYLTRMLGRREMADELTQETFLTVIRKISFFRAGPDGGLKAWVFRIASNLAIDSLRREKRMAITAPEALPDSADPGASPQDALEGLEFTRALESALHALTAGQRTALLLREQEGMSCLEISRVCGCNENAVKQLLFRARAALRKQLSP